MDRVSKCMQMQLPNWIYKDHVIVVSPLTVSSSLTSNSYQFSFVGHISTQRNFSGIFYDKYEMKFQFGTLKHQFCDVTDLVDIRQTRLEMVPECILKALREVAETGVQQIIKGPIRW